MKNENLIEIGTCTSSHGVKGGAIFNLYSGEESILDAEMEIIILPLEIKNKKSNLLPDGKKIKIFKISYGNKIIAYLDGINSLNDLETLIPFKIMLDRKYFPEANEGEVYMVDLINFKVIDENSSDVVGVVHSFYDNGVQDIIVVQLNNNERVDIPYLDVFIKEIDEELKTITIAMPDWSFT